MYATTIYLFVFRKGLNYALATISRKSEALLKGEIGFLGCKFQNFVFLGKKKHFRCFEANIRVPHLFFMVQININSTVVSKHQMFKHLRSQA